jgi:tetratricopeptide (TPR) repeat protein
MPSERVRCRHIGLLLALPALMLWLSLSGEEALARGGSQGLHWGYQPPAGNWRVNIWREASWFSALSGGGITHHDLGPSNLNMGGPSRSSHGSYGSVGSRSTFPQTNRAMMFPGSSSQPSGSISRPSMGGSYAPIRYAAPTGGPYLSEDRFNPPYYQSYNGYWHHGYWGGGLWGWAHWDHALGVWSFPRWGEGPFYYASGYGRYRNPFTADDTGSKMYESVIDLDAANSSDPLPEGEGPSADTTGQTLEQTQSRVLKSPEVTAGLKAFDAARTAFRSRDYPLALRKIDESLEILPHDPALHEFRSLVLFAQGEFRQSAAVIYAVLAVSPGWDWTTLSSLYAEQEEYTEQLRTLETYRKQNPETPEAAFLVAYHYATCGHNEIAVKHLRNVARLLPTDNLTPHLASLLSSTSDKSSSDKGDSSPSSAATVKPGAPANSNQALDQAPLDMSRPTGKWRATRGDVRFELTFAEGSKFTWDVDASGQTAHFEGSCLVVGNQLLLSCGKGTLIGVVTTRSLGSGFHFRLLENTPSEAGLDFDR